MGAVTAQSSLCGPREEVKGVLGRSVHSGRAQRLSQESEPRPGEGRTFLSGWCGAGCDSSIKVRAESRGESRPCGESEPRPSPPCGRTAWSGV